MNRLILFIMLLTFLGCDTSKNIKPLGEDYFIKFYGAIGDQEGVSVQSTPDGGFIIGGNSISEFEGQSDYLLIKLDAQGNQEWIETYDFNGSIENDILQDVIVDTNSYVIAGTSKINNINKIILLRVDLNGNEIDRYVILENNLYDYTCTGVTLSGTGNFVTVGSLDSQVGISEQGNSLLAINNSDLDSTMLRHSGIQFADITHVKAFEITDANTQEVKYLAVGFKETNSDVKIGFFLYNNRLDPPQNSSNYENFLETKTTDIIPIEDGNFMILGKSNDLSVFVKLFKDNNDYTLAQSGTRIQSEQSFLGKNLAQTGLAEFAVSGDIMDANSTKMEASVLKSNSNSGNKDWQRIFGTDFSYTSGKVLVLNDGSVVFTGTAGFKDQTKVFLIKLKSNGEMK